MLRRRIPAAVLLIRNIGRPHCCSGEGLGGEEQDKAAGLGDVGLGTLGWRGVMGRDSGGGAGWCGCAGGRSDVGLGVAGWPDGACRDCTRQAFAAALAEPASSHRRSLLMSSRRVAPGGQPLFESRRQKFCYCGDSNSLEHLKIILNQQFHAANNPKIGLEFNTLHWARGKEFCSHSTIQGIKL